MKPRPRPRFQRGVEDVEDDTEDEDDYSYRLEREKGKVTGGLLEGHRK